MPKRPTSTTTSGPACAGEPIPSEPAALTAAIAEVLTSQELLDILIHVPALSSAIADTVSQDIHKALELELLSRDKKIASLEKEVRETVSLFMERHSLRTRIRRSFEQLSSILISNYGLRF